MRQIVRKKINYLLGIYHQEKNDEAKIDKESKYDLNKKSFLLNERYKNYKPRFVNNVEKMNEKIIEKIVKASNVKDIKTKFEFPFLKIKFKNKTKIIIYFNTEVKLVEIYFDEDISQKTKEKIIKKIKDEGYIVITEKEKAELKKDEKINFFWGFTEDLFSDGYNECVYYFADKDFYNLGIVNQDQYFIGKNYIEPVGGGYDFKYLEFWLRPYHFLINDKYDKSIQSFKNSALKLIKLFEKKKMKPAKAATHFIFFGALLKSRKMFLTSKYQVVMIDKYRESIQPVLDLGRTLYKNHSATYLAKMKKEIRNLKIVL